MTQVCRRCDRRKPLNSDYFDRDMDKESGFRTVCKQCRKEIREGEEEPPTLSLQDSSDLNDRNVLEAVKELSRVGGDPNNLPHIATVLENLMRAFGGIEGFSRHVALNYLASRPGSMARNKILQSIMSMAVKVSESGATKPPLDLMDEADLRREMETIAARLDKK